MSVSALQRTLEDGGFHVAVSRKDLCVALPAPPTDALALRVWARRLSTALLAFADDADTGSSSTSNNSSTSSTSGGASSSMAKVLNRVKSISPGKTKKPLLASSAPAEKPMRPVGPPPQPRVTRMFAGDPLASSASVGASSDAAVVSQQSTETDMYSKLQRNKSLPALRPKPLPATPPVRKAPPPVPAPRAERSAAPQSQYSSVSLAEAFSHVYVDKDKGRPPAAGADASDSFVFDELPPLPGGDGEEHMSLCGFSEVFAQVVDLEE
jgi:hypothetical protein